MPRKNPTAERLAGLPFDTASDLKAAQREILLAAWTRLEGAKALHELTKREEYAFWREEFAQGLMCSYGGTNTELVRVFSDSPGIKIAINQELATTIPASATVLGVLVKAMSESFANTYYKAKGILPGEAVHTEDRGERHA
jgi:hypothetical protein